MSGSAWQEGWQTLAEEFVTYGPGFLSATLVVLGVTVASILVSWVCGLLGALGKRSTFAPFRALASFYVWFIRGTPTLIQVFIVYFGMPQIGVKLSPSPPASSPSGSAAVPTWPRPSAPASRRSRGGRSSRHSRSA